MKRVDLPTLGRPMMPNFIKWNSFYPSPRQKCAEVAFCVRSYYKHRGGFWQVEGGGFGMGDARVIFFLLVAPLGPEGKRACCSPLRRYAIAHPPLPRLETARIRLHFSRSCATICVVSSWQSGGGQQSLPGCGRSGAGHGTSERAAAAKRGVLQAARRTRRPLPPRSAEANLCRARPLQRGERRSLRAAQFGWNRGAPACKKTAALHPVQIFADEAPFLFHFWEKGILR